MRAAPRPAYATLSADSRLVEVVAAGGPDAAGVQHSEDRPRDRQDRADGKIHRAAADDPRLPERRQNRRSDIGRHAPRLVGK